VASIMTEKLSLHIRSQGLQIATQYWGRGDYVEKLYTFHKNNVNAMGMNHLKISLH